MKEGLSKGNYGDVDAIADDVKQNLEKINHHGKRADAIVKGMLQHSRSSTGVKEPTDMNTLAEEYLRLAYHGLSGKDNSFNVAMKTDFDNAIEKINIVPQDIGRVLLNLYNNAFYAVNTNNLCDISTDAASTVGNFAGMISLAGKTRGEGLLVETLIFPHKTRPKICCWEPCLIP